MGRRREVDGLEEGYGEGFGCVGRRDVGSEEVVGKGERGI